MEKSKFIIYIFLYAIALSCSNHVKPSYDSTTNLLEQNDSIKNKIKNAFDTENLNRIDCCNEFCFSEFNIFPVNSITSYRRTESSFNESKLKIKNAYSSIEKKINAIIQDKNIYELANSANIKITIDTLVQELNYLGLDGENVTIEPYSISYFEFQKDTFLLISLAKFDAAPSNYITYYKVLLNSIGKSLLLGKNTAVKEKCFGDFNSDDKLDYLSVDWNCDLDTARLYSLHKQFQIDSTYYFVKKNCFPEFDKNLSYLSIYAPFNIKLGKTK